MLLLDDKDIVDTVLHVDDDLDLRGLAPMWVDALRREGLDGVGLANKVRLWRQVHGPPPPERLEWALDRVAGRSTLAQLSRQLGVPHSRMQSMLARAALQALAPHLPSVPQWSSARAGGASDPQIARMAGTRTEVVTLALDGWPGRATRPSEAAFAAAVEAWRDGASRADVAAHLGLSRQTLTRRMREGRITMTPQRWYGRDVRERFGWTDDTVTRHRTAGRFPAPDGRDGLLWWWPRTITDWETNTDLTWCPECGLALMGRVGWRVHQTQIHSSLLGRRVQ